MRRVEEEFQRKRAREKANIRQQLRLVSSGAASMPVTTEHTTKVESRDSPDGSCRASPGGGRARDAHSRANSHAHTHSNASSEVSGRSKSTTPVRSVELGWRAAPDARVYRDWAAAHAHPPACARMPIASHALYSGSGCGAGAFSGSPVSDNYRREFARGRSSPRTPRAPRLLAERRPPSSSGSELSRGQPINISEPTKEEPEEEEPAIVPTLRPSGPARTPLLTH